MPDSATTDIIDVPENGLELSSAVLEEDGDIPSEYTCDGAGKTPPLSITGVDETASSMVLLCEDPDAPTGTFDHWVVYNLAPDTVKLEEGEEPPAHLGVNTAGSVGYYPPCPPGERHRYVFTLISLDTTLNIEEGLSKQDVLQALDGHVLQKTDMITYYERS